MIRVSSPLSEEIEGTIERTIGCGIRVHRELGPGFVEPVYHNAFCLELEANKIPFECEKSVVVKYRDTPIALHRIDLIVCGSILVELKAVTAIDQVHTAQVLSYLRATGLHVGLLMNFNAPTLQSGLRRIVL